MNTYEYSTDPNMQCRNVLLLLLLLLHLTLLMLSVSA